MTESIVGCLLAIGVGVSVRAWAGMRRQRIGIVTFGPQEAKKFDAAERTFLLNEQIKLQRWAFWLAWGSIAIGVVLGAILIGRFVLSSVIDTEQLAGVIGEAADIGLAGSSIRLYKITSSELRKMTESLRLPDDRTRGAAV